MTDFKNVLRQLRKNLNTLREREAKYGDNAPLTLLNQIKDHQTAITLTRQTITSELAEAEWRDFGLLYGGMFLIQHYLRLWMFKRHNLLPFNLIPFLNRAAELLFLQRLGGSYRFVHRSVQEYFASLTYEGIERLANDTAGDN